MAIHLYIDEVINVYGYEYCVSYCYIIVHHNVTFSPIFHLFELLIITKLYALHHIVPNFGNLPTLVILK